MAPTDQQISNVRGRTRSVQYENIPIPLITPGFSDTEGRSRSLSWTTANPSTAAVWVSLWYIFSIAATFLNKILIKRYELRPETLSIFHLLVSNILDFGLLRIPEKSRLKIWYYRPINTSVMLRILPLSIFAISAKLLTYWSYNTVPVSVTQTAKASTPFFNVIIAWIMYSRRFNRNIYISLFPIVLGVIIASVSELQINKVALNGLFCAILSSLIGVLQSMYAKSLLRQQIVSDSINLHFYNGVMQMLVNFPIILFSYRSSQPQIIGVPMALVLICSLLQFLGSLVATLLLGKVTELTYSILSTFKRVVVIINSIFYFGNPISLQSVLGMSMAVGGLGYYQYAKLQTPSILHGTAVKEHDDIKNNMQYPV